MSQSLVANHIHVILVQKNRMQLIHAPYEKERLSYLGGICNNNDCVPIKIGGYADHTHVLCKLSKKITLIKLLEEVKAHSSKWLKTKDEALKNFTGGRAMVLSR